MEIILDLGSGNTCKNDVDYMKKMIDEVIKIDNHRHQIAFKPQLFLSAATNIPLDRHVFIETGAHALNEGYGFTASVFDLSSLRFLLDDIPNPVFVKIANNRSLDWLIGEIPRKIPVYQSVSPEEYWFKYEPYGITQFLCVSKYPATVEEYKFPNSLAAYHQCVSDHTIGLELVKKYKPKKYECHFCLEDSQGLDAGPWAKRPNELKEILNTL